MEEVTDRNGASKIEYPELKERHQGKGKKQSSKGKTKMKGKGFIEGFSSQKRNRKRRKCKR